MNAGGKHSVYFPDTYNGTDNPMWKKLHYISKKVKYI